MDRCSEALQARPGPRRNSSWIVLGALGAFENATKSEYSLFLRVAGMSRGDLGPIGGSGMVLRGFGGGSLGWFLKGFW